MTSRYVYSSGHKTREDAEQAIIDLLEESEVSPSENPEVEAYIAEGYGTNAFGQRVPARQWRYRITLED